VPAGESVSTAVVQAVPGGIPVGTYTVTVSIHLEGEEISSAFFDVGVQESCD